MRFKSTSSRACILAAATIAVMTSIESAQSQDEQPKSSPLSFRIGAAEFTPGGFVDFENVFKSSNIHYGASLGGLVNGGPSVNSSSAFYRGETDSFAGPYFNAFANRGIGTYSRYNLRAGAMIEAMHGSFDFTGTAGGIPATSSGSLWQVNVLATLPITTPLSPSLFFSVTPVVGIGFLKPTGAPGGPAFTSWDTAGVAGFDVSLLQPITSGPIVRYNVGYRRTGPTSFSTTLPGERYNVGGSNAFIGSISVQFYRPVWKN